MGKNNSNAAAAKSNLQNSPSQFLLPQHLQVGPFLTGDTTLIKQQNIFIAPSAVVIGDVRLDADISFWYNTVVRGDVNYIKIAASSNLQDGVVVHVTNSLPCIIGQHVTIGHGAIVHAATIEDGVLIGMGSTILSGAHIGRGSIVAAGAVVKENEKVPPLSLMAGVPAKKIKDLPENTLENNIGWATKYVLLKNEYLKKNLQKNPR